MRIKPLEKTFALQPVGIDEFSEWFDALAREVGVERKNRTRVRLLAEEVLLRMQGRMDDQTNFTVLFYMRFGMPRLRFEILGRPYNPLGNSEKDLGGWDSSLRTAIGIHVQYGYDGECNILKLRIPHRSMNPTIRIAWAIIGGMSLGLLGNFIMPEYVRTALTDVLFIPVYDVWHRLLNAISGPIVFCTVATTMLNTRGIEQRGGNSVRVIVRYFALSVLAVAFAMLFGLVIFPLEYGIVGLDKNLVRKLFDNMLRVVPGNVVEPFVESNTQQLLFLSFVLGYVLIRMGSKTSTIKRGVREANMIGLQLAGWMSVLVPPFVCAFLCLEHWQGSLQVLVGIWQPLSLALLVTIVVLIILVLAISMRMRTSPFILLRKVLPPFITALRTGSLDDSFGEVQDSCSKQLGIDREYTKESLPQGLVLYMPASAIGTILFTFYAAQLFSIRTDALWHVSAAVMAVVVFVATPPVPGANLLAYVVLFKTLGIPDSALIDAMTFDVVFGIFAGAANQMMLQFEMLLQANRVGMLDVERLRAGAGK
ncbi:MAG: cation:dicarboxylase symporter family transporter [Atopobiaceae bacterium]|nr:cation:dicarboxylase symporter family transporter [Atopobiaceae bacterium]